MLHKSRKIYLCYDAVHLIKNVRNILLKFEQFTFPQFKFSGFTDPINVPGGESVWKTLHDVFKRDTNLHANSAVNWLFPEKASAAAFLMLFSKW